MPYIIRPKKWKDVPCAHWTEFSRRVRGSKENPEPSIVAKSIMYGVKATDEVALHTILSRIHCWYSK